MSTPPQSYPLLLFCQVRCDKTVRRAPLINLEKSPAASFLKNTSGGSRGAKALPADSSDDEANVPSLLAPAASCKTTSSSQKKAPAPRSAVKGAASEKPPPAHKPEKWACKACTLINPGRSHLSHNPAPTLVNLRPHLLFFGLAPRAASVPAYALTLTPLLILIPSWHHCPRLRSYADVCPRPRPCPLVYALAFIIALTIAQARRGSARRARSPTPRGRARRS